MMSRQQGVVIGVGAVLVLACAGISAVLLLACMKSAENKESLDAKYQDLKKVYAAAIFPDDANIAQIRDDQKVLGAWLGTASNELAQSKIEMKTLTRVQFKSRLEKDIREMVKQVNDSGRVRVAADFWFGFEQYKGEVLPPDSAEVVSRLNQQLDIIQQLVGVLCEANIARLDTVGREVFEGTTEGAAASPAPRTLRRDRQQGAAPGGGGAAVSSAANLALEEMFDRQRFTVQFLAYPETFTDVLNRLSAMGLFVVIAEMEMKKTGDSIQRPEAKKNPNAKPGEEGADAGAVHIVTNPRSEPPFSVRLSLDVYSFKGV